MVGATRLSFSAAILAALAACTPSALSPSVQALPGNNKSTSTFASDNASCRAMAQQQASEQQRQNATAIGTNQDFLSGITSGDSATIKNTLIGVTGTSTAARQAVQQQYDATYQQCMASLGDLVPGMSPAQTAASSSGYDPALVRSVQAELIRIGMLNDNADGAYGPRTRNAISTYQQTNGLAVDGQPSAALLASLKQHSDASATLVQPVNSAPAPSPSTSLVAPVNATPAASIGSPPAASGLQAPITSPGSNP